MPLGWKITAPMMGFKAFHSAVATIARIETAHMIRKGEFGADAALLHKSHEGFIS